MRKKYFSRVNFIFFEIRSTASVNDVDGVIVMDSSNISGF